MATSHVVTPDSPLAPYIGIGTPIAELMAAEPDQLASLVIAHINSSDHPEARHAFMYQLENHHREAGPQADTSAAAALIARDHIADTVTTVQHLRARLAA